MNAADVEIPNSETLGERVPRLEVGFMLHGDVEDAGFVARQRRRRRRPREE